MLRTNPEERLSAEEILRHPWLQVALILSLYGNVFKGVVTPFSVYFAGCNSFLFTQDPAMMKKADCLMDTQRKSKKRVLGEEVDYGISHKFIKKI